MKKVFIKTYGCQMNKYDSEMLAGLLQKEGCQLTYDQREADLILLNTCYVREKVKHKVFSELGQLKKLKINNPSLILGVGGCLVQRNPSLISKQAPYVDIIWGTHNLYEIAHLVKLVEKNHRRVIEVREDGEIPEGIPVKRNRKFSSYIPVMRGCNNFCSYCNVPYVRGREKSRALHSILKEIKELAKQGFREIILLGQNVNSYGKDLPEKIDFADLLSQVQKVEGISRIRFTTSHPKDLSDKLIRKMAELDKVCEHLHLPLQAGSNRILKKMGRGYTKQMYENLVIRLREAIPEISITTDIIVGFPGERKEDFEDTLDMVRRIRFDGAFTFAYSPLAGTKAFKFDNQVPDEVKSKRLCELIDVQKRITEENNQSLVGKEFEVLVEGVSVKNPEELQGRIRQNKIIVFKGEKSLIGKLVNVKVLRAGCWASRGERIIC